ncbi:WG repeat-containing protein [Polaribacter vadi]|uniref:WG repeat-containing protein n=1 Tax=Polaribacter vadi TaxID=1774273 RepID=UPI0030ECF834|tara:strand:- start:10585 stop:11196 length:612 start_codon:yes stop_codon:yes gene_type:complete
MKRVVILFLLTFLTPFIGFTQTSISFDYVSPFYEGFSAVKKGNQWAFINTEGVIVIDFRDDLVSTKINNEEYPIFKNNRCIIVKEENKISYFGYIDSSGKTVINPTFLNATNFQNSIAIVLKLNKEKAGFNNVLGKNIVYYTYLEVITNKEGEIKENLTAPKNVVLSKKNLSKPPKITSKFLSDKLVLILDEHQKWIIKKIAN